MKLRKLTAILISLFVVGCDVETNKSTTSSVDSSTSFVDNSSTDEIILENKLIDIENNSNLNSLNGYEGLTPSTGDVNILLIPIHFKNINNNLLDTTLINKAFNSINESDVEYYSVKEYYKISSYEKLNLNFEITEKTLDLALKEILIELKKDENIKLIVNPPLRSEIDRQALLQAFTDGTVDVISTDHAPHSAEEKSKGLAGSAFGVVGIETAFAVMYTHLVETGVITLEKLIELLSINPRKRFGIPAGNDFTVWNLSKEFTVDPADFLSKGKATGSGIIMTADGYIVTNAHVVDGAENVTILLDSQNEYEAEIIGSDAQTDIAVLKISADEKITPAEFGNSDELVVGETAVAIGNPLGFEFYSTVTSGIISGLDRELTIEDKLLRLIQTDAAINGGNSGGALVNSFGQVIGISSAKIVTIDAEGMGFAIPINDALPIIHELINNGYVTGRPLIGIAGFDIDERTAFYYNMKEGVYVAQIKENSPAELAGMKVGDIIISANDTEIKTMIDLNKIKNDFKPNDTVSVVFFGNLRKNHGQRIPLQFGTI